MSNPNRTALMLSAFVCPGAGQFLQKRWLAGLLYATTFLVAFIVLIVQVFKPMLHNLAVALSLADNGTGGDFESISRMNVFTTFAIALTIYLLNLADTARGRRIPKPPPLPPRV